MRLCTVTIYTTHNMKYPIYGFITPADRPFDAVDKIKKEMMPIGFKISEKQAHITNYEELEESNYRKPQLKHYRYKYIPPEEQKQEKKK